MIISVIASADPGARKNVCYELDNFRHCEGALATAAISSFLHGDKLEIGIETLPNFRNQGLASVVCSALIDYCIANQFEPIWSCRLTNGGSYHLAVKLGFDPVASFPYYELV